MNQYTPKRPSKQLPDGTIEIQLTQGQSTIIDAEDADLAEFNWYARKRTNTNYVTRNVRCDDKQKGVWIHRVILARKLERELTEGEVCDHIDGNGLNNQRSNLRLATEHHNAQNRKKGILNTSGYKGVTWHKNRNKWLAQITVDNKTMYLGYFVNPEEAHQAYCKAALEHYGEFANSGEKPLQSFHKSS